MKQSDADRCVGSKAGPLRHFAGSHGLVSLMDLGIDLRLHFFHRIMRCFFSHIDLALDFSRNLNVPNS